MNDTCHIRSDPGSVADVDTLKASQRDNSSRNVIRHGSWIIDDDNFDILDTSGLYFFTPLKRNSIIIDYSVA